MELTSIYEEFIKYFRYEKSRTARTVQSYQYNFVDYMGYLKACHLPLLLSSFDFKIVRGYMYKLHEKKLDKATIRQRMLSLKSFCKYLLREGHLESNPFDRFDIPSKKKNMPRPLNDSIRDRLLDYTKEIYLQTKSDRDLQNVVMMEAGFKTGLRKKAMRNMLWEYTNMEEGFTYVKDKGDKFKHYPLTPSVASWLKELKKLREVDRGPIFLGPKARRVISETSLYDEFKRCARLSGLDEKAMSLHNMRHTFGTNCLEGGLDIRKIQEAMGHDDINSTLAYVQVSKKGLRLEVEKALANAK